MRRLVFAFIVMTGCSNVEPADLVLRNGTVHTMNDSLPRADAVAIRDGRIVFVGDSAEVGEYIGDATQVIDAARRLVLPGFIDAHVHPLSGYGLYLAGAETMDEVFDRVSEYAASHPDEAWIEGYGWDLNLFPERGPRRETLDRLVPDRPALIWGGDGHSVWVNSPALAAAGIDRSTPDPEGGRIERDEDGRPSGTLREAAATVVERVIPPWSLEKRLSALERSLEMMRRYGITSFMDAAVDDSAMLAVYQEAARRNLLTAHASVSMAVAREAEAIDIAGALDVFRRLRESVTAPQLQANTVKIFVDGVIEAGTAAMLEPYEDTEDRGELLRSPEVLDSLTRALHDAGFQVHYHAIGDRAIRVTLDAIEAAGIRAGDGARPLIAHVQVVDDADVPRFAALGAVPVFQALWAYADAYITDLTMPRLGPARSRAIYPIRTLLDAGAPIAMGSDWPVSSMDPLRAIEVAVTRVDPDLRLDASAAFLPRERITAEQAVRAYTLGSARATRRDQETGSIEVGKRADLILLSMDILSTSAPRIADARVLLTISGGRVVYRDPEVESR